MIRSADAQDSEAVATVLIESRREFLPFARLVHPEEEVREWVRTSLIPSHRVVVWEEEGSVVALLASSTEPMGSWIDQLYVLPGWNGKGIGTKLLLYAHSMLPKPIRLYTFQASAGARRFYERNGYEAVEFTDGQGNEEKCPDVLYAFVPCAGA